MAASPRMLGSFIQGTLEAIDRHDADLGRRVRDGLRPASREAIAGASRIAFLDIELDVEVTELLYRLAGPERARAVLRANLAETFASPILRSFITMALRLRGREPARLLEWSSKVWGQIYRDSGSIAFVPVGASEGRFELIGLPPAIAEHGDYVDGIAASMSAVFDLLEVDGRAELKAVDPATGRAIISAFWETE
jgi:hypothetical protein